LSRWVPSVMHFLTALGKGRVKRRYILQHSAISLFMGFAIS
jgi:hypothetical protein